jgi:hypothetical protein
MTSGQKSHEIFLDSLVFPSSANLLALSQQFNITSQSAMRLTYFHTKAMGRAVDGCGGPLRIADHGLFMAM